VRRAFEYLRHAFELASAVALLVQLGAAAALATGVSYLTRLSPPFSVLIFIASLIIVFSSALLVWAQHVGRSQEEKKRDELPPRRIGYIGRSGSKGNLRKAKFGKTLDVGIDNAGNVDASEAEFS
jgi:membrane protein implicated in regulation of membrane protease activity